MQTNDLPRIGVLSADPAAVTQFLRRVQALGADPTALLPLSPAAVPDCEPYLCGTSTQSPLPKLRAAAEVLAASGCTVIAAPDSAGVFCEEITAAVGIPTLGVSGPALQQLVGKLRQRASVLCTPGVRAANGYGIAARRYGLYCSYPDAPVQALLGCVQPEKACSEQVLRSIIELELARGNDSVVLDSAQPVKVYVTGFVRNPGLYGGVTSDSLLNYLIKAGGVDPERGSYVDIVVKRGNRVRSNVNLYDFLLNGKLGLSQFADGDTIIVGPRQHTFSVQGDVFNSYDFEFRE